MTELEIRTVANETPNSGAAKAQAANQVSNGNSNPLIEIVALSQQPQQILFQGQFNSEQIRLTRPGTKVLNAKSETTILGENPEGSQGTTLSPHEPVLETGDLVQRGMLTRAPKGKSGLLDFDSSFAQQQSDLIDASENDLPSLVGKHGEKSTTIETKFEAPAVRFSLPDNLTQYLKPEGKSLTIRIEPEHLGPARLSLTVHDERLTARLTVDTVQAKATIEQSLDQLSRQLERAGVKVDHIEVSLRGGGAGLQFSNRQADWFRPQRAHQMKDWNEPSIGGMAASVAPVLHPLAYMSATTVNLYA